jgi:hypothetical protein
MRIRTHMRAGEPCGSTNTNCKGIDTGTGQVFWNNCDNGKAYAGYWCWKEGQLQGIAHPYCYKC